MKFKRRGKESGAIQTKEIHQGSQGQKTNVIDPIVPPWAGGFVNAALDFGEAYEVDQMIGANLSRESKAKRHDKNQYNNTRELLLHSRVMFHLMMPQQIQRLHRHLSSILDTVVTYFRTNIFNCGGVRPPFT